MHAGRKNLLWCLGTRKILGSGFSHASPLRQLLPNLRIGSSWGKLTLGRPLALHRHPRAGAGVRPVVPHRAVLGAAVVPERNRILGPAEAALEQRIFGVLVEIGQHRVALIARDADDLARKTAVDIERLL